MAFLVLKIDVDTLEGTYKGVPNLVQILRKAGAGATFLFSLGPDHTGWALRRVFQRGFLKKVSYTSVLKHYGIKTLSYGILLPGPDIGAHAASQMCAARDSGFEVGIHAWDHVYWQDNVRTRERRWTIAQMEKSYSRFVDIFGEEPRTHGAAGWKMNECAFYQLDAWKIRYASDGRGHSPYRLILNGLPLNHVQLPTTLPTLDEALQLNGLHTHNIVNYLLSLTQDDRVDNVFTLHAELEGRKFAPILEQLLAGWRAQGHILVSMADYYTTLNLGLLPSHPIEWGKVSGRVGRLIIQPTKC
ncbi:polysaccharide deacetylase family protein [Candidatus Vallotia tarda]|uniref:Probable 4-deoxy-4-formamido-L-arabinose-phosphoundecaprenol deformylase ArnD n=1 Tax=Candidatus Vallotiella hemipterorum TaxID=1177213 RepID=A0A916NGB0_9BURK|nr:polysaccharide deacetylase family protein [Candidatus Vallotia tarda]CAG7602554.1 Probable 4-deoxy-4-formamido-L-arabinose-phosphoundecaprenol deformylase ArnD [Candidatus Vallotia tarda]